MPYWALKCRPLLCVVALRSRVWWVWRHVDMWVNRLIGKRLILIKPCSCKRIVCASGESAQLQSGSRVTPTTTCNSITERWHFNSTLICNRWERLLNEWDKLCTWFVFVCDHGFSTKARTLVLLFIGNPICDVPVWCLHLSWFRTFLCKVYTFYDKAVGHRCHQMIHFTGEGHRW